MTISPGDGGSGRSRHPPPLSPPPPLTLRGRTHPPPRADSSSRYFGAGDGGAAPGHARSCTRRARSGTSARTFPPCPHPSVSYLSPSPSHPGPVPVPIASRSFPCPPSYPIPSHVRVHPDPHLPPCHHAVPLAEHPRDRRAATTPHPWVPSTVPGYRREAGFGGVLSPTSLSSGGSGLCNPPPQFSARMNFKAPPPPTPLRGPRQRLSPLSAAP